MPTGIGNINSLRQLAKLVGRAHTTVLGWTRDSRWPFSKSPPWSMSAVREIKRWAKRELRDDPGAIYGKKSKGQPATAQPSNHASWLDHQACSVQSLGSLQLTPDLAIDFIRQFCSDITGEFPKQSLPELAFAFNHMTAVILSRKARLDTLGIFDESRWRELAGGLSEKESESWMIAWWIAARETAGKYGVEMTADTESGAHE